MSINKDLLKILDEEEVTGKKDHMEQHHYTSSSDKQEEEVKEELEQELEDVRYHLIIALAEYMRGKERIRTSRKKAIEIIQEELDTSNNGIFYDILSLFDQLAYRRNERNELE